jgi:hypothetical protein
VPAPLSANVIVCGDVLRESATELLSAIRMMSVITVPSSNYAHFYSIVFISSAPGDIEQHKAQVRLCTADGTVVASANEYEFTYGYRIDPTGIGGFVLRTEFNVDLTKIQTLGTFWLWAFVDGAAIAKTPLMLRR